MLTHRLGIEHQHTSLEVIVGVLHLQHGLRIIHTLTMLYVQIAKEIDIAHCAKQLALQIDVVELCDITVDDDVGIKVQHLVIERQELLNQETIVCFHADMGVVGGKLISGKFAVHVGESQIHVRELFEEPAHTFLLVPSDVALQYGDIVEIARISVLHGRIHGGSQLWHIVVICCEHHRNDRLVGDIKRFKLLGWLWIGEVHALQLLELPVGSDALVMHEIDIQQAFGKMAWRTQCFLAVRAVIGVLVEFLKDREHPLAVVKEDFLLHDEHVAEACLVAVEETLRILLIIRIHGAQNLITALQIVIVQQGSGLPQSAWASILVDDYIQIAERCGDDVILFDHAGDVLIIQTVLLLSLGVDIIIHNFTKGIFLMRCFGEIKITAVMAEAVVVGIDVFPCPVLRGQFAIAWIEIGDVLAFVIMERPREAFVLRANLYWLHDGAAKTVDVFMRGDENADILLVVVLERFGIAGFLDEIGHMGSGDSLHLMESYGVCRYLIGRHTDGVGYAEPAVQISVMRKELVIGKQRISIIAYETVQFAPRDGRAEHSFHLLGGLNLFRFRNPDLPIIGKDFGRLALETLCASVKHIGMLLIGEFVGCIEIRLEMAAIAGILRSIDHICAAYAATVVIHISAAFLEGMVAVGECRNYEALVAVLRSAKTIAGHGVECFLKYGSLV